MNPFLHRLHRLHVPTFSLMLADLGNPSASTLARAFGVSRSTVHRWIKADEAPRPVALSLYWLSTWGQSELDAELQRSEAAHRELSLSLKDECERLRLELSQVLRVADCGSANAPLWRKDGEASRPRRHAG